MPDNRPVPQDMRKYCDSWRACIARDKADGGRVYDALKAMGRLASEAGKLDTPIEKDLFEILIWSEANLRDVLIANKGLAMLASDDQEKYILQGQHYMNEGKFALAEEQFRKAQAFGSNRANVCNFLSLALARQGKAAAAADTINQAIVADGGNTRFLMRGAQYNLEAGNLKKAQAYIEKMAENQGAPAGYKIQVSRLAMRAEMEVLGRGLAETVVENAPGNEAALEHLVNIVARAEGETAVFKIVRQHINAMPDMPRLKEWYIRTLIDEGKLERALRLTKGWIAADGPNFQAQFQLGRVYLAMRKPRSAARALAVAEEIKPDHAPTQKLIADTCIFLGDLAGATRASGKACKIDPDNRNFKNQAQRITELILAQAEKDNAKPRAPSPEK
jgi:predicted Zn-dependent protease